MGARAPGVARNTTVPARDPGLLRVVTYNVHKCRGLDQRTRPERIAWVLGELDADVVALQEVLHSDCVPHLDQVRGITSLLDGYAWHFGEVRHHRGSAYGNATLSRLPVTASSTYDITWQHRERRGCLRTDVQFSNTLLHVFNVHLGTSAFERPHQARRLLSRRVLHAEELRGPRIVMGDFNEWTRGVATKLMSDHFDSVDRKLHRTWWTYPGLLPFLHLDHFYYDKRLKLERFYVHRSRTALVASDHLPLVADFRVPGEDED